MEQQLGTAGTDPVGHLSLPHTADLRIEAWAATREECVAEAIRALVESFTDPGEARPDTVSQRHIVGSSDADLLVAALDEVIYGLDTQSRVPLAVEARPAADGGIDLTLRLAGLASVEITGAAPKAATLSDLRCEQESPGRWSCAVTVDV